eukprot:TRINITY_DN6315_c0_g1_i1.p2 TRINITY_DN6315_c0_g1~~TRINITY_DN6315_c0_g1_i1.p2  ORF type:complete len:389 (+),score=37.08 TRINITY_DN6315_c0_g1_i1:215-1381(+)
MLLRPPPPPSPTADFCNSIDIVDTSPSLAPDRLDHHHPRLSACSASTTPSSFLLLLGHLHPAVPSPRGNTGEGRGSRLGSCLATLSPPLQPPPHQRQMPVRPRQSRRPPPLPPPAQGGNPGVPGARHAASANAAVAMASPSSRPRATAGGKWMPSHTVLSPHVAAAGSGAAPPSPRPPSSPPPRRPPTPRAAWRAETSAHTPAVADGYSVWAPVGRGDTHPAAPASTSARTAGSSTAGRAASWRTLAAQTATVVSHNAALTTKSAVRAAASAPAAAGGAPAAARQRRGASHATAPRRQWRAAPLLRRQTPPAHPHTGGRGPEGALPPAPAAARKVGGVGGGGGVGGRQPPRGRLHDGGGDEDGLGGPHLRREKRLRHVHAGHGREGHG